MDDAALKKFLGIEGEPNADKLIAKLPPEKRATFERMAELETEIALWQEGLAPKPKGVLIDLAPKKVHSND